MGYIGNQSSEAYSSVDKQVITGNGGTAYTLSHSVANANEIEVFVNNVRQEPGIAYTVSAGTSLAMTGNVASTDDFYVVFQGKAIQTTTPPDGSVTSAKLDTNIEITGDLTVDTNTLHVDAANNRVGIGTTPDRDLHVKGASGDPVHFKLEGDPADYARIMFDDGTTENIGELRYNFGSDYMSFNTNSAERMRILSSGGITFNGDTAAANALDDYEEGTFTPSFTGGITSPGYSVQVGTYTKIGRQVICSINLRANSGTAGSSQIRIGNLPFTVTNAIDHTFGGYFTYNGGFWTSSHNTTWLAFGNSTNLGFYQQSNGGGINGNNSNVASNLNADLRLVAVYTTD